MSYGDMVGGPKGVGEEGKLPCCCPWSWKENLKSIAGRHPCESYLVQHWREGSSQSGVYAHSSYKL